MSNLRVHVLIPSPMKSDKHIQDLMPFCTPQYASLWHCKLVSFSLAGLFFFAVQVFSDEQSSEIREWSSCQTKRK
jgi:hypothetical protein